MTADAMAPRGTELASTMTAGVDALEAACVALEIGDLSSMRARPEEPEQFAARLRELLA